MDEYGLTFSKGFLPEQDPLTQLPSRFCEWEKCAENLPKWLTSDQFESVIHNLPPFPTIDGLSAPEIERTMLILSYLGQAYVWSDLQHPRSLIPAKLAVPWHQVASTLARPPILSYASYALNNWRRLEPKRKIELGNICLLQNFLGGLDEEWFILVHVAIEARAAPAIQAIIVATKAAEHFEFDQLSQQLQVIQEALAAVCEILARMPEHCDPYIYYNRVRPYIHGWKNNPALPVGVIYEDVVEYNNKPVQFKGETGAQSSIIPLMDAFFGIRHTKNPLEAHLVEMQEYMPRSHRKFLERISRQSKIRSVVQACHQQYPQLRKIYNDCLHLIYKFRSIHFSYAAHYIQKQQQISGGNPTEIGTGGTPFMEYLRLHKEEIEQHLI